MITKHCKYCKNIYNVYMRNYITIKQASKLLGVTEQTLRNWDKSGKVKTKRHPVNNYRVYTKEDIMKLQIK